MRRFNPLLIVVLLVSGIGLSSAQTVTTDPVGFTTMSQLGASDTFVSIPFTRIPAFTGAVSSVSGNQITISGAAFTASPPQFVYAAGTQPNHYYALIGPGGTGNTKEGHSYPITSNDATSVTVSPGSDSTSGIVAGAQILIIPNWTLGTLYPSTDQNVSFTPTTSTRTFKTQILIPNYNAPGVNQGFSTVYFFSNNVNGSSNNVGWRVVGNNTAPRDDDPLLPDGYFVVRNLGGAPTHPVTPAGAVLTKKFATPLMTQASQAQDNSVAMIRPIDVSLNNTGLGPADGSFVATTSTRAFKDQLLLYDNTTVALNKSPSKVYFYSNNVNGSSNNVGWRIVGDNTTDRGGDIIPAGSAMVIRKAANGTGGTVFWTNAPTY